MRDPQPTVIDGARRSVALAIPVFAFGVSFGAIATELGMTSLAAVAMSATTFAGAAQFAAVTVLGASGSVVSAVLAGTLLNIRYLPIGLTMAPAVSGSWWKRVMLSHLIVDESWAVSTERRGAPSRRLLVGSGLLILVAWVGGTAVGALGGGLVDPSAFGLDAAFPAVFLGLLVRRTWNQRLYRSVLGGLACVLLIPLTPPGIPILAAAALGVISRIIR